MAVDTDIAVPGSYQQYKSDTAAFLTWLLRAAQAYGYSYTTPKNTKTKEVEIEIKDCRVPVREILEQARIVCSGTSSLCTLPRKVSKLAERAIACRQQFTLKFRQGPGNDASNDAHEHFTTTLCQALDMLQQHATKYPRTVTKRSSPSKSPRKAQIDVTEIQNLFQHLEVEDCEEADWSLHIPVPPPKAKQAAAQQDKNAPPDPFYDHVDRRELWIRINCFFNDLHGLRAQVAALWKCYKEGDYDLIAVTMASNAAIAIAGQMEQELLHYLYSCYDHESYKKFLPPFVAFRSTYAEIEAIAVLANLGPGFRMFEPAGVFDEYGCFWFEDIGMTLSKFGIALKQRTAENKTLKHFIATVPADEREQRIAELFPRVESLEMLFLSISMRPEVAFEKPGFQTMKEADEFLTILLTDIVLHHESVEHGRYHHTQPRAKAIDEFSRAIVKLESENDFGAAAVLGCTILWDLHELFKDEKTKPYDTMCKQVNEAFNAIKYSEIQYDNLVQTHSDPLWQCADYIHHTHLAQARMVALDIERGWEAYHFHVSRGSPLRFVPRETDLELGVRLTVLQALGYDIDDRFARMKALREMYLRPRGPAPLRYWHTNPLACGTMTYNVKLALEQSGVCLANQHLTVVYTAHLYTALKQRGFLQGQWEDMDNVIRTHVGSIFFGAIPNDPERAHCIWGLRTAMEVSLKKGLSCPHGLGGDRTGKLPLRKAQASCLSISDTSHLLTKWLAGEENMIRTVYAIGKEMKNTGHRPQRSKLDCSVLDNPNFLIDFTNHITEDCARFQPYIPLTKICLEFLTAVNHTYRNEILANAKDFSATFTETSSLQVYGKHWQSKDLPTSIFITIDSLLLNDRGFHDQEKSLAKQKKEGLDWGESPMVDVGKFVQKYLDGKGLLVHEDGKKENANNENADELVFRETIGGEVERKMQVRLEEVDDEEFIVGPPNTFQ